MKDPGRMVRILAALAVVVWLTPPADASAQEELSLYAFGGLGNTPGEFDVVRQVDYGSSPMLGAGFSYALGPLLSLRGDVGWVRNTGDETELVQESVEFTRVYYTAKLQLSYELEGGLQPYAYGGGGVVSVERDAQSYGYDFNEVAGTLGIGVHYGLPDSPLGVFAEGEGWFYNRNTTEGSQFDKAALAGISYTFR